MNEVYTVHADSLQPHLDGHYVYMMLKAHFRIYVCDSQTCLDTHERHSIRQANTSSNHVEKLC